MAGSSLPFKEKIGRASYFLTFSGGLWSWPFTAALAWYGNIIVRTLLVLYLTYIWFGPARKQPSTPDGPVYLRRCNTVPLAIHVISRFKGACQGITAYVFPCKYCSFDKAKRQAASHKGWSSIAVHR